MKRTFKIVLSHHPREGQTEIPLIVGVRTTCKTLLSAPKQRRAVERAFPGKRIWGSLEPIPREVPANKRNEFAVFIGSFVNGEYRGRVLSWHRWFVEI